MIVARDAELFAVEAKMSMEGSLKKQRNPDQEAMQREFEVS